MKTVVEPYMVKMTSPEESNQYSSGQEDRRYDRGSLGWFTMQIAWHKRGVLVPRALNLASGYESVLETLFSVGESAKELKDTRPPTSTRIGIS